MGVRVTLLTPTRCEQELPCRIIELPLYDRNVVNCWQNLAAARDLLHSLTPDLVHLHGLFALQSIRTIQLAARLPAPLIVSTWGSDVDPLEGGNGLTDYFVRRYLLAQAARITATSRFLADRTRHFCTPGRHIDVVPFGVEDNVRISPYEDVTPRTIGFFKGYAPTYGADVLLHAAARLRRRGRNDFRLEMIGRMEQAHATMELARALEVNDIIDWVDYLPRTELLRRVQRMFVTVIPSRKESFGVAALESQLLGVPVVAANVGGLPETVVNGKTGILFPPGDAGALAEELECMLANPRQRWQMGKDGRAFVLRHYSWRTSIQKMIAIYHETIAGNGAAGLSDTEPVVGGEGVG